MNAIEVAAISVGVLILLICCFFGALYCFAEIKYRNATPFIFENPSFKNVSNSRKLEITYVTNNIDDNINDNNKV